MQNMIEELQANSSETALHGCLHGLVPFEPKYFGYYSDRIGAGGHCSAAGPKGRPMEVSQALKQFESMLRSLSDEALFGELDDYAALLRIVEDRKEADPDGEYRAFRVGIMEILLAEWGRRGYDRDVASDDGSLRWSGLRR
jgi:hypothetical protein